MGDFELVTMCRGCMHQSECDRSDSDAVIGFCDKFEKDPMRDFAEVVRCINCRYSHEGEDCYICRNPDGLPNEVFWFDFCSNGKRRENNDE